MTEARRRSQRYAACAFLLIAAPLAIAIAISGGLLALAPLGLIVVPILVTGRAPGVDALERVRARVAQPVRRPRRVRASRPRLVRSSFRGNGLLLANSLAERGPPLLV